jgi:hypothetical protein
MDIDFDHVEDTARRECLRWWLESVSSSGGQWWPIPERYPERGTLPHTEWVKVLSWNTTLFDFLVPLGLLRCRSLVQLSYASDYPHALRCVVDWSGPTDEWKSRVCQALIADKHWPQSWPDDFGLIAITREDWHVSFPLNLRLIASLATLLNPLPPAERVEKLLELCSTEKQFDIQKARIEGISFSDGQWFGTPEQDLRTNTVGELKYPFGDDLSLGETSELKAYSVGYYATEKVRSKARNAKGKPISESYWQRMRRALGDEIQNHPTSGAQKVRFTQYAATLLHLNTENIEFKVTEPTPEVVKKSSKSRQ